MGEEAGGRRSGWEKKADDGERVIREEKNLNCTNFIELDDDEISNHVGNTQIWMISDSREAFDKSKPPYGAPN